MLLVHEIFGSQGIPPPDFEKILKRELEITLKKANELQDTIIKIIIVGLGYINKIRLRINEEKLEERRKERKRRKERDLTEILGPYPFENG